MSRNVLCGLPGCRLIRENPSTHLTDSERALLVAIQRKPDRRVASLVGESGPMERALVKLHTDGRVLFHNGAGGTQPLAGPMVRITPAGEAALGTGPIKLTELGPIDHGDARTYKVSERHLSHGFYRVTDGEALQLATAAGAKLPRHGYELIVNNGTLMRTPYRWQPRGWVWAVYEIRP